MNWDISYSAIVFTREEDQLILSYKTNDVYSYKSIYVLVNFRGIQHICLHVVWDNKIPLRGIGFPLVILLK
jgi:hypothetical protein